MFILFLVIVGIGLYLTFNTLSNAKIMPNQRCEDSPYGEPKTHKWVQKAVTDQNGYLICSKCGKEPGSA